MTTTKVVCIGDEGCGKSTLLLTFIKGDEYTPTLHDVHTINQDDQDTIEIHDTGGSEDMDRLPGSRKSFTQVKEKVPPHFLLKSKKEAFNKWTSGCLKQKSL
ncbi:hypothetical protein BC829DRAFT_407989 [Chytridium lagenaria]|nr:hypothetical protein BC829DRAFT_407989 [Chytridium lagenaria]